MALPPPDEVSRRPRWEIDEVLERLTGFDGKRYAQHLLTFDRKR